MLIDQTDHTIQENVKSMTFGEDKKMYFHTGLESVTWRAVATPPLEEFLPVRGHTARIWAQNEYRFMYGHIPINGQFFFGWVYPDKEYVKGVYVSNTEDNRGVFMVVKRPGAAQEKKEVCMRLRKHNGASTERCIVDNPGKFNCFNKSNLMSFTSVTHENVFESSPQTGELKLSSGVEDNFKRYLEVNHINKAAASDKKIYLNTHEELIFGYIKAAL
jgi:hypothetical protein